MPHITQAYPFESKVLAFANSLSGRLASAGGDRSFLMELDSDGAVRTLRFECAEGSWRTLKASLDRADTPYIFYDPFDVPEYTWLSWRRIDRPTMERLMGECFEDADFQKHPQATSRAPDLISNEYPESWGVMS